MQYAKSVNPLNAALNPICHLLALLGAHHILHLSRIRINTIVCVSDLVVIKYFGINIIEIK